VLTFNDLRKELNKYLDKEQVELVAQAYQVAEQAHHGQIRASGEPYISHPTEVAHILASMRLDHESIMAALLHDVLEDTSVDKNSLAQQFGESVADLVDGVSKLNQMEFATRAEAQAESFRKMLLAMVRDIRVILVKLADRLHNMRTLNALPPPKRQRIAKETLDIYAPIANRLGMYKVRLELEDLCFQAIYPLRYRIVEHAIQRAHGNRKEIMQTIEQALVQRLQERGMKHFAVHSREKHLYGIYRKMKNKHLGFNSIMDVYGFRIVVDNVDDCYRALGIAHSLYKPLLGRFKDYIAIPKANNYQSLHTTLFGPYAVPIEVQIRTKEMEALGENGIAAHWAYKNKIESVEQARTLAGPWLKSLEEIQRQTGNSLEFIENVKIDLFPDEVYVFTPKGEILELPAGATVVDFAYAVHTDVGDNCVAAKVNRQLMALSTVLANGQSVEIITAKGARPNPTWLNFVVTGKARSHIRHFLKGQRRAESINLGLRLLEAALNPLHLSMDMIPAKALEQLAQESGFDSVDTLYEEVGLGQRIPTLEARRIANLLGGQTSAELGTEPVLLAAPLQIKGTEGLVLQFATCCHPIPGDEIIGYLQVGQGLQIHRAHCTVVNQYHDKAEKCMPVEWKNHVHGEFICELQVDITHQRGMLALLAVGIADMGANIEDIKTENQDGRNIRMNTILSVHDRKHLARVIRRLRKIKGILRIHRTLL
jgi:guanosine-3',5'-bis(diphosphate) 3'-pyrophosphohydrolase